MTKVKPNTKEQLVYFLHNHVSLGTYDRKFIENLITMYISTLNPVTTNQSNLLDKITLRYERQLRKDEINANDMTKLNWAITPIPSSPKYTEAYIDINDNIIEVRSPFKSEFVKAFRSFPMADWNKSDKVWTIPANETNLRKIILLVNAHYEKINYCTEITQILDTLESYTDTMYWAPTLVQANGLFYIAAMNKSLDDAIRDIPLNNSLHNLARLVYHGVTISRSALQDIPTIVSDDEISFALDRNPNLVYDNIDKIVSLLKLIDADYVLMRERSIFTKAMLEDLQHKLKSNNIRVDVIDQKSKPQLSDIRSAKMPILIGGFSYTTSLVELFAKTIGLVNNNPIELK